MRNSRFLPLLLIVGLLFTALVSADISSDIADLDPHIKARFDSLSESDLSKLEGLSKEELRILGALDRARFTEFIDLSQSELKRKLDAFLFVSSPESDAYEKRDVSSAAEDAAQESITTALENLLELTSKQEEDFESFSKEKTKYDKKCVDTESSSCSVIEEELISLGKEVLIAYIDILSNNVDLAIAKLDQSSDLTQEKYEELVKELNDHNDALSTIKSEAVDSETKSSFQDAVSSFRSALEATKLSLTKTSVLLKNGEQGRIIAKYEVVATKLECGLDDLSEEAESDLEDMTDSMNVARSKYISTLETLVSMEENDESTLSEAKRLVKETNLALKDAHESLRSIYEALQAEGIEEIEACEEETDRNEGEILRLVEELKIVDPSKQDELVFTYKVDGTIPDDAQDKADELAEDVQAEGNEVDIKITVEEPEEEDDSSSDDDVKKWRSDRLNKEIELQDIKDDIERKERQIEDKEDDLDDANDEDEEDEIQDDLDDLEDDLEDLQKDERDIRTEIYDLTKKIEDADGSDDEEEDNDAYEITSTEKGDLTKAQKDLISEIKDLLEGSEDEATITIKQSIKSPDDDDVSDDDVNDDSDDESDDSDDREADAEIKQEAKDKISAAKRALGSADLQISSMRSANKDVTKAQDLYNEARALIDEADDAYDNGDYTTAILKATEAEGKAKNSKLPSNFESKDDFNDDDNDDGGSSGDDDLDDDIQDALSDIEDDIEDLEEDKDDADDSDEEQEIEDEIELAEAVKDDLEDAWEVIQDIEDEINNDAEDARDELKDAISEAEDKDWEAALSKIYAARNEALKEYKEEVDDELEDDLDDADDSDEEQEIEDAQDALDDAASAVDDAVGSVDYEDSDERDDIDEALDLYKSALDDAMSQDYSDAKDNADDAKDKADGI